MIYADHAATTPLCEKAREAMQPYLEDKFYNPSGQYRPAITCRQAVERSRRRIAELLGCGSEEIYFTSGGSEGNSWAALIGAMLPGKLLVTTPIEHHSMLRASEGMRHLGTRVIYTNVNETGQIMPDMLVEALKDTGGRQGLVSIQYANNELGTIQSVPELAAISHEAGMFFHTDAVQAVGHIPISLSGIDLLTASAHKFEGPKGIGFMYIRNGLPRHPLIYGGDQEGGVRGGTENVAAIVGMAAALEQSYAKMKTEQERIAIIEKKFRNHLLEKMPVLRFNGNAGNHLPGLCSLTLPLMDGEQAVFRMDLEGIAISAGAACDRRKGTQPSHVLTAIGMDPQEAIRTIRISFGSTNNDSDGETVAEAICHMQNGMI